MIIVLQNGAKLEADYSATKLTEILNDNHIMVIKINGKLINKNIITMAYQEESLEPIVDSLVLNINQNLYFTKVEDTDKAINTLEVDFEKQIYLQVNDIVFNRLLFVYAEKYTGE